MTNTRSSTRAVIAKTITQRGVLAVVLSPAPTSSVRDLGSKEGRESVMSVPTVGRGKAAVRMVRAPNSSRQCKTIWIVAV